MKNSKTNILISEIAVMTAIIAVVAAGCCMLFAKAFSISLRSENLSYAVMKAESAAETFKVCGSAAGCTRLLGGTISDDGGMQIDYDGDWKKTDKDAKFLLRMNVSQEDGVRTARITVSEAKGGEIYALTAELYAGGGQ